MNSFEVFVGYEEAQLNLRKRWDGGELLKLCIVSGVASYAGFIGPWGEGGSGSPLGDISLNHLGLYSPSALTYPILSKKREGKYEDSGGGLICLYRLK